MTPRAILRFAVIVPLLMALTAHAGKGRGGGKEDPADCPCYAQMTDLVAQTACTLDVLFQKVGKGKSTTQTLIWQTPPGPGEPKNRCSLLSVSTIRDEVLSLQGEADGSSCRYPREELYCLEPGELYKSLTDRQLAACQAVLKAARTEIEALPDC